MQVATIQAAVRQDMGKKATRRLRAEGRVPGVMYGLGSANEAFSLDAHELQSHLRRHHRIYKVKLGSDEHAAYLQDVQWDNLTDEPMHLDFKRIDMNEPMELVVEVKFVGHPVGIGKGGQLVRDHSQIDILALPTAIPDSIPVKIDHLEIGDRILAKDLVLPDGVTLRVPPEMTICHLIEAKIEVVAAPVAAAGAAPAEGAAAAPGAEPAKAEGAEKGEKGDKAEKADKGGKDKK